MAVYGDGEDLDFFTDGETENPKNLINSPFCYKYSSYYYLFVTWGDAES